MIILYCTNTLWVGGGIEHVTIAKANSLAAIDGNDVWIAVADNRHPPTTPLDPKIHIVDLALTYYVDEDKRSRLSNLVHLARQNRLHKKELREVIRTVNPDIVISTDSFGKYFLPYLRAGKKQVFIREYHMYSKFSLMYPKTLLERIFGWCRTAMDAFLIKKYDRFVLLTNEDKEINWRDNDKAIVIPNPIISNHSYTSLLDNKTVSAVGRLCHQKNFELLIEAWSIVNSSHPDWKLDIYGEGPDKTHLTEIIHNLHLEDTITLQGYDNNIFCQLASSSMLAVSSIYEGFPLVIIEAMSCGLPVISSDCPCGPKDIIANGKNGFLVPCGNTTTLAERICQLIEDSSLRDKMGKNALETSKKYTMDQIISIWMDLFKELIAEKRNES